MANNKDEAYTFRNNIKIIPYGVEWRHYLNCEILREQLRIERWFNTKPWKRTSVCCLPTYMQHFSYITARTIYIRSDGDDLRFVVENTLSWIFNVIAHW